MSRILEWFWENRYRYLDDPLRWLCVQRSSLATVPRKPTRRLERNRRRGVRILATSGSKSDFYQGEPGCACTVGKKWLDIRVPARAFSLVHREARVGERFAGRAGSFRRSDREEREKERRRDGPRFFSSVSIVGRFDSTPGGSNSNQSGIIAAVLRSTPPPPPVTLLVPALKRV